MHVCVCMYVRAGVNACMCLRDRERMSGIFSVCLFDRKREREGEEREVRSENVCERYSVHLRERKREYFYLKK